MAFSDVFTWAPMYQIMTLRVLNVDHQNIHLTVSPILLVNLKTCTSSFFSYFMTTTFKVLVSILTKQSSQHSILAPYCFSSLQIFKSLSFPMHVLAPYKSINIWREPIAKFETLDLGWIPIAKYLAWVKSYIQAR